LRLKFALDRCTSANQEQVIAVNSHRKVPRHVFIFVSDIQTFLKEPGQTVGSAC
jgi:hypothetical protein